MRYYAQIENGYIDFIGTGNGGKELSKEEYLNILNIIKNKPINNLTNFDFKLRDNLTWEQYEIEEDIIPNEGEGG